MTSYRRGPRSRASPYKKKRNVVGTTVVVAPQPVAPPVSVEIIQPVYSARPPKPFKQPISTPIATEYHSMFVIATLSRFNNTLFEFLRSLRKVYSGRVIVVDDGLVSFPFGSFGEVEVVKGKRPFVFSYAANQALKAAGDLDVLLCNDDITFDGCVECLAETATDAKVGLVSPAVTGAGAYMQVPGNGPLIRDVGDRELFFSAIYIPRHVINSVGPLDDIYSRNFSGQDLEYTDRVRKGGFKNMVDERCVVHHERSSRTASRISPVEAGETHSFVNSEVFHERIRFEDFEKSEGYQNSKWAKYYAR